MRCASPVQPDGLVGTNPVSMILSQRAAGGNRCDPTAVACLDAAAPTGPGARGRAQRPQPWARRVEPGGSQGWGVRLRAVRPSGGHG